MQVLFVLFFLMFQNYSLWNQPLPRVEIQTSMGNIILETDTVNAPVTAKNFLTHVENGTFKNAVFYRTVRPDNQPTNDIKIEVIQGGLFSDAEIEKHLPKQ
jgi:peptidyl-prolyl cis-trans isomerase A (cyclophilin A)